MGEKFINTKNLYALLDLEPFSILLSLFFLSWFFYKVFLREASEERHRSLQAHFKSMTRHLIFFSTLFLTASILHQAADESSFARATPYVALAALVSGITIFIKTCRLIILQYLFLGSMKHGVPVLIVNIFSLLMSLVLIFWVATSIFSIELTPLLATSAAFSVILGLALQDTLGNLFAGISLQIDGVFDIGDWLEVTSGMQKAVGQVKEITWRGTILSGWADEVIILPNRFLANSQIANFSLNEKPIVRSQSFRLKYGTDLSVARQCLLESIKNLNSVCTWPEPVVIIADMTDSWITLKLAYYIENYGSQYAIADSVAEAAMRALRSQGIELASSRLEINSSPSAIPVTE